MRPLPVLSSTDPPLYTGDLEADLAKVSRTRLAEKLTGGLSFTSKMPCPSFGIPATRCRIGSVLAQKEGTTCSNCYALRGRYLFPNVRNKLEQRYQGLFDPLWTPSMVFLIRWYADRYFRWFDSGDLQGQNHLRNIVRIATETPQVSHWLPTREAETVRAVGELPENLVVRVSSPMIDGKPLKGFAHTSRVVTHGETCPAPEQGGSCAECRNCWDADVQSVSYRLH